MLNTCVDIDEEHFHLPNGMDLRRDVIQKVRHYWQNEFRDQVRGPTDIVPYPRVATQRLVIEDCDQVGDRDIDIRFQFGTLTPDQLAGFTRNGQDPRDFVSAAIRTDYDRVNLRAKGFIYLAPDSGPYKPRSANIVNFPWSMGKGGILLHVFSHELGHLFGVSHSTIGRPDVAIDLMAATFPEAVMREGAASHFSTLEAVRPYFTELNSIDFGYCRGSGLPEQTATYFGVNQSEECLFIEGTMPILAVSVGSSLNQSRRLIGQLIVEDEKVSVLEMGQQPYLWLSTEQAVIRLPSPTIQILPIGLVRNMFERKGLFRSSNGNIIRLSWIGYLSDGSLLRVGGWFEGNIVLDVMDLPRTSQK